MKSDEVLLKRALEILSEKHPVSKPTLVDWCERGLVKCRIEYRGKMKLPWRIFKLSELERVKALMPKNRVIGLSLLPRKP